MAYAIAADHQSRTLLALSGQDALDMRKPENSLGDSLAKHFRKIGLGEHAGIQIQ